MASETVEKMKNYDWPGNVRELKNIIERLVIMVQGERIERRNLPPALQHDGHRPGEQQERDCVRPEIQIIDRIRNHGIPAVLHLRAIINAAGIDLAENEVEETFWLAWRVL